MLRRFVCTFLAVVGTIFMMMPTTARANDDVWSCTSQGGVWVIVVSPEWSSAGCAPNPSNGEEALAQAGFGIEHNYSGLICQIGGFPGDCPRKPPFEAYWSYWHAQPNGQSTGFSAWEYSQLGAISYRPNPGSIEGWWFGDGMGGGQGQPPLPVYTRDLPQQQQPQQPDDQQPQDDQQPSQDETTQPSQSASASTTPTPTPSQSTSASSTATPTYSAVTSSQPRPSQLSSQTTGKKKGSGLIGWIALAVVGISVVTAGGMIWWRKKKHIR